MYLAIYNINLTFATSLPEGQCNYTFICTILIMSVITYTNRVTPINLPRPYR